MRDLISGDIIIACERFMSYNAYDVSGIICELLNTRRTCATWFCDI